MKDIFKEFMAIAWNGYGNRMSGLTDTSLGNYIITRISGRGISVIWLLNGNRLNIPWEWTDLFTSFNTINGERVLWAGQKEIEDEVDQTIYDLTLLINQYNWGKCGEFLETLANVCEHKTEKFREWYKQEFGEKLNPLEFITLEGNMLL